MEGALKLKEVSRIHAQAYAAGELKHGPLALVEGDIPILALAPNDSLLEKLIFYLQKARIRGGELFFVADESVQFEDEKSTHVLHLPTAPPAIHILLYSRPLRLLVYHLAILNGAAMDKARNLVKSVTMERQ